MTTKTQPKVFGTGLIALDLVLGQNVDSPVGSWTGGTCGNVLSILAFLGWEAFPIARMNGDPASDRVRADMARWGIKLDFTSCGPTAHTPIIVQQIKQGRDGLPKHRFSWSCPKCGKWLPGFKPVTREAVDVVSPALKRSAVFFFDRVSRANLTLAKQASDNGAVVVFEPSGNGPDKQMAEAIELAHIVKYADQRLGSLGGTMKSGAATILEIQTLGARGLRYRHRFAKKPSEWMHLNAVKVPRLADACGAGDWCTAGLIEKVAMNGLNGLQSGGARAVRMALRYGQVLAAWNCGFEGARGGMYSVSREAFNKQVDALAAGQLDELKEAVVELTAETLIECPGCLPEGGIANAASQQSQRVVHG